MNNFLKEFKEFALKGNVLDMAIGIIIGAAFGKIVTSVVNDILMPALGLITGNIDFTQLSYKVGEAEIKYGMFIQNVIDFLIIALAIFFVIKGMNKISKSKNVEEEKPADPQPSQEEKLLTEIRDLLKNK